MLSQGTAGRMKNRNYVQVSMTRNILVTWEEHPAPQVKVRPALHVALQPSLAYTADVVFVSCIETLIHGDKPS